MKICGCFRAAAAGLAGLVLSGCMSMSGLSEAERGFACKAPMGVSCKSVSGVYANAKANNLPALHEANAQQRVGSQGAQGGEQRDAPSQASSAYLAQQLPTAMPGVPIRSQARTLRIWVAPWVDEEGDLHDQTYLYLVVNPGKWMVDNTRDATVKRALTRLKPPVNAATSSDSRPTADASARQSANDLAQSSAELGAKE